MRCDGKTPCQRCESNKTSCIYSNKPSRPRSKPTPKIYFLPDKAQCLLNNNYKTQYHKTACPVLFLNAFQLPIDHEAIPSIDRILRYDPATKKLINWIMSQHLLYAPWLQDGSVLVAGAFMAITMFQTSRQKEAELLYREVHLRFLELCFPHQEVEEDPFLVETALLLVHYQCMAKSETQAFMTLRIALDLVSTRTTSMPLLKTLEAWYVWLTVYLNKPYLAELDVSSSKFAFTCEKQKWAFDVTEAYTKFLKCIVLERKPIEMKIIRDSLDTLSKIKLPKKHALVLETPQKIITLYHHMLTVQIYNSAEDLCTEKCLEIITLAHHILTTTTRLIPQSVIQSILFASNFCKSTASPLYTPLVQLLTTFAWDETLKAILDDIVRQDYTLKYLSDIPMNSSGQKRSINYLFDYCEPPFSDRSSYVPKRVKPLEDYLDRQQQEEEEALMYGYLLMDGPPYFEDKREDVTKLPLPQPSNPVPKLGWNQTQRSWSKFFIESEVQTLHYPTTSGEPQILLQEEEYKKAVIHQRQPSFSDSSSTTSPTSTSSHYPKRQTSRQSSVDAMAAVVWATGFPGNIQKSSTQAIENNNKLFNNQGQWINTEKENHCWTE
ncbi:hypothetical protein G6F29_006288 [Rhizopus arrhizus]|uniref:Zn(2)-C6 fungal-type domain-containing protein n=1 Tax=Rhizopus oryzae TaxID=64495 RepID=A0A9P7BQ90_RHIOR|nr:hypothetical protein G6F24_005717 [Rhizopus arrhizus]KAG0784282.1 hypothetical protein G6F22_008371 [Rhizopus arrhizus]KAG0828476.1 hypothetical protein G6F19_008224 [Rhizopus arrhizus]KAG0832925.1 hypothetical protein G6F18_007010 [Rhizopus arrhizus]KAG0866384.1 hypothetical protein G6F16_009520 [Rhizopus arrhizus]